MGYCGYAKFEFGIAYWTTHRSSKLVTSCTVISQAAKIIKNLISEELIIVTDENRANHTSTNIYYQEYDGRDTNRLNEVCQQSTSGRLPQYKVQFNYS